MSYRSADGVEFRRARPSDAGALTELALAAKRHWGYPENWMALWREDLAFTAESIRAQAVIVADAGGRAVGVAAVSRAGAAAELEGLWVDPSSMGRGLGRELFRRAVDAARAGGAEVLVIVSDPNAAGFYESMGATRAGDVASTPAGRRLPKLVLRLDRSPAGRSARCPPS